MGNSKFSSTHSFLWKGKTMTAIVTIGIGLAKNVFAVHGVDATGKPALVCPALTLSPLRRL
jgi:transposase